MKIGPRLPGLGRNRWPAGLAQPGDCLSCAGVTGQAAGPLHGCARLPEGHVSPNADLRPQPMRGSAPRGRAPAVVATLSCPAQFRLF